MSTLFAEDDGGGSPSGDVVKGVDVDDLVALGQDAGHFLFLHSLSDIAEALGNHPEDILEVVGYLMTRFVARTVSFALVCLGVVPEGLADAFFHDPADLAAGGIVFNTDGDVPEELAVHEFEAFAGEVGALLLDEFGFRVAFVFHVG